VKITRQHLIDLAKTEVLHRSNHGDVISGYLIGSVAGGDPLLGETADIDLVLIHTLDAAPRREAVRLSHQVHLDISHHSKDLYLKPSDLRIDPWLGPALCEPIFLHDPDHFFEWAQAGARGQFFRPDHVYSRATAFIKRARQGQSLLALSNRWLKIYLRAAMEAANAVASLDRFPVSGRRQALDLALQAAHFEYPELYSEFLKLIGRDHLSTWDIPTTLAGWARAYDSASVGPTQRSIPPCRRDYYLHGFQALVEDGQAEVILWPLLQIWERVMATLPDIEQNETHFEVWHSFLRQVKLSERDREQRSQMLLAYIEQNASYIEHWAKRAGA
jgi:hypothetical protein